MVDHCFLTVHSLHPHCIPLYPNWTLTVPQYTLTVSSLYPTVLSLYPPCTLTVSHCTPTEPSLCPNVPSLYPHCTLTVSLMYPPCILNVSSFSTPPHPLLLPPNPNVPQLNPYWAPMYPHCTPLYSHCILPVPSMYPTVPQVGFPWAYSWIVKSISYFITWIKVEASGQIWSAADYIGEWIETGPRKTHLFNTDDCAVSLRWVFAVQHRIYWSECVIQADEPVHRTRRLMYL